jgi:D-3-phosphoglycerate dehydrogenase / 2-oxoglutarate reductase
MTLVLAAGDLFVTPELFARELRAAVADELDCRALTFPWPIVPFGPVGNVHEASGTEREMIEALAGCELAVTQLGAFTATVIESSPALRWIGVSRGGPVNVDLAAASAAGVAVSFAPGRNAVAAAEYTISLMLDAMRHVARSDSYLRAGQWRGDYYTYENSGIELDGATVGLVGYGAIGSIVARILLAFGATVLIHDPYVDPARASEDGVVPVDLDELLTRSSIVSLHARVTPETRHMLNAENLALLPQGAVLVNMARGDLLDYDCLPALIESGRIGALAVDVFDEEPPPSSWPLFRFDQVTTTPHLAGATKQTAHRAASIVAAEAARFLNGQPLLHLANPDYVRGQR